MSLQTPFCQCSQQTTLQREAYFTQTIDYLKDKVHPEFVKTRRQVKREYEEFKVRVNALVAASHHMPLEGWTLEDGSPWPGNNRKDHDGIVQALCFFLDPIDGHGVGFVQFPQRFDGIDKSDRYANRNTVFFDIKSVASLI